MSKSALALLLLFLPASDGLQLRSEKGAETARTLTVVSEHESQVSTLLIMDEEQDVGAGMKVTKTATAKFSDMVVEAEDGRATLLSRTYEEIDSSRESEDVPDGVGLSGEDEEQSLLSGHTVLFSWKDEEYTASFPKDDEDGDEVWLEGLVADMDLSFLLPEDEVSEGDDWTIDAELLPRLVHPAGRITYSELADQEEEVEGEIRLTIPDLDVSWTIDGIEGDITVKHAGTREEDGAELVVLEIELEVTSSMDVGDAINANQALEGLPEFDFTEADSERVYTGTGEVLWNVETGRLYSYHLEFNVELIGDAAWTFEASGMELELGVHQESTTSTVIDLQ